MEVTGLEVSCTLYAAVDHQDDLTHSDILSLLDESSVPAPPRWPGYVACARAVSLPRLFCLLDNAPIVELWASYAKQTRGAGR